MTNCEWCEKRISGKPYVGSDGGKYCSEYCLEEADDIPVGKVDRRVARPRKSDFYNEEER